MKNVMRERLVIALMVAVMVGSAVPALADQYNRQRDYQVPYHNNYGHHGYYHDHHHRYDRHHRDYGRYHRSDRGHYRRRTFGYSHGYYSRGYSAPPVIFAPSPPPPPVVPSLNIVIPFRFP